MNFKSSTLFKIADNVSNDVKYKVKSIFYKWKHPDIDRNKIMLAAFQGKYSCNPKAICQEIIREKLPYRLVWAINEENKDDVYPNELKLVVKGTREYYEELTTARILIDNSNNLSRKFCYEKKKDQIYFQTWHGSMGLKRMAFDRGLISRVMLRKTKKYQGYVDYCISNSTFETELFRQTYWPEATILEYGHPRNDILFAPEDSAEVKALKQRVNAYFRLQGDEKIFLYAPTFREIKLEWKPMDYAAVRQALIRKFGGTWVIIVKLHHRERALNQSIRENAEILDATYYDDIQDLVRVASVGVTDYSSWICDYVLMSKPAFLYAPDLQEYTSNDRGFAYPLEETPFAVTESTEELIAAIQDFDLQRYEAKRQEFLKRRGCRENGNAAYKTVQKIREVI